MTGLQAAIKVLFQEQGKNKEKMGQLEVSNIELVGLVNLLAKLSESIVIYQRFIDYEDH